MYVQQAILINGIKLTEIVEITVKYLTLSYTIFIVYSFAFQDYLTIVLYCSTIKCSVSVQAVQMVLHQDIRKEYTVYCINLVCVKSCVPCV